MGSFGNNKILQFGAGGLTANESREKGEECSFMGEGGDERVCCKQRARGRKHGVHHRLNGQSLSLAERLPGEETILLLPAGVGE